MTRDDTQHQVRALDTRPTSAPLSLEFDAAEFAHFLHETGWSDEQKAEYVTEIWNIMCQFVALGWGVHPVQQAQDTCGEIAEIRQASASLGADVVDSSHADLVRKFMRLSGGEPARGAGGFIDE